MSSSLGSFDDEDAVGEAVLVVAVPDSGGVLNMLAAVGRCRGGTQFGQSRGFPMVREMWA